MPHILTVVLIASFLANIVAVWALLRRPEGAGLRPWKPRARVLRVGIDLVEVEAVAATLESDTAERYLARVYTDREVRDCTTSGGVDAARLAARFAAKEAVMKALRVGDRPVPWRAIEVRKGASGEPTLRLRGVAALLAQEAGVSQLALSLTHERDYASAMVVAGA